MKAYSTIPNTTGAFPNTVADNASGPGETDGTPYIKQVIDDLWGARQDLMTEAKLTPDGNQEAVGTSQFLAALTIVIKSQVRRCFVDNWRRIEDTALTTDSFFDFAYVKEVSGLVKKVYVAVGQRSADSGLWSSQGGNGRWIERTNPTPGGNLNGVIWDPINDLFIAVGAVSGADANIITSPDGTTWLHRANPKTFALNGLASDGSSIIVAVGAADGTDAYIVTSPDGINWTERANPKNFGLNAVTWSDDLSLFIAVGVSDGTDTYIITSPDGINWTERTGPDNLEYEDVAASDDIVVAVRNSNNMMRSTDGVTWTGFTIPQVTNEAIQAIVWSPELKLFVAGFVSSVDDGGIAIALSPDGIDWSVVFLGIDTTVTDFSFYGMVAGAERIIGGGLSGSIGFSLGWDCSL
jgi:hypothetical protein